jgi:hypothetical protein
MNSTLLILLYAKAQDTFAGKKKKVQRGKGVKV